MATATAIPTADVQVRFFRNALETCELLIAKAHAQANDTLFKTIHPIIAELERLENIAKSLKKPLNKFLVMQLHNDLLKIKPLFVRAHYEMDSLNQLPGVVIKGALEQDQSYRALTPAGKSELMAQVGDVNRFKVLLAKAIQMADKIALPKINKLEEVVGELGDVLHRGDDALRDDVLKVIESAVDALLEVETAFKNFEIDLFDVAQKLTKQLSKLKTI